MLLVSPKWRMTYWPGVLVALVSAATSMANFFLPVFFRDGLGFSGTEIGLLYALFSMTTILAVLPVGWRNDRTSPRWLIAAGLTLIGAAGFGMAGVKTFLPYLFVFFLYGLGISLFRISIDTLVFKTSESRTAGERWGSFNAFRMIGVAMGTIGAGYVLAVWGFPGGLRLLAALALASLAITPLLLPVKVGFPRLHEYLQDLRAPGILGFLLWLFLFSLHWGAELTSYGLFLRKNLQLPLSGMGWFMAAEFLALTLTCLWAGPRSDRGMKQSSLAIAGLVISGTGQILMCVPVLWLSLPARCLHGVGDGFIVIVTYLGIARLFDQTRVGGHNSTVALIMMVGTFIGSLLFGPLGEKLGYAVPLIATGALVGLLALPVWYAAGRTREPRPATAGGAVPSGHRATNGPAEPPGAGAPSPRHT